jgi:hypothetical protein
MKTITLELHQDPLRYKVLSATIWATSDEALSITWEWWLSEKRVCQLCADPDWVVYVDSRKR